MPGVEVILRGDAYVSMEKMKYAYTTVQVATALNIGRSTVNKYARSLEEAGYYFVKDDKERRTFVDHDIVAFRAFLDLLHRGVEYDRAVKATVERYKWHEHSDALALSATPGSSADIATLNAKVDEMTQAMVMLTEKIDQIVDERVRSEVAAAAAGIGNQVNEVLGEVRAAQDRTDQKVDELLTRAELHGKRKRFWIF